MRQPQPTRRRRGPSPRGVTVMALVALSATIGVGYVAVRAPESPPLKRPITVTVAFGDLSNLGERNDVRLAGRRVGQVVRPRYRSGEAVIDVQLERGLTVRSDARFLVRSKGLLGARYLEIIPGGAGRPLRDGDDIPVRQTSTTVQLTDVFEAFPPQRRADVRTILGSLSAGVVNRGADLNTAFARAPRVLDDFGLASDAVTSRGDAAETFVPSLRSGVRPFELERDEIRAGLPLTARALRPLADAADDIARMLAVGPGSLRTIRTGLARTDPLLREAHAFADAATGFLDDAPPAFTATERLLRAAPRPLTALRTTLDRVEPIAPTVSVAASRLTAEFPRIRALLTEASPILSTLGAYGCDIVPWASNWRSMLRYGQPGGGKIGPLNILRLEAILTGESVSGVPSTAAIPVKRNPYPQPCEAGQETK